MADQHLVELLKRGVEEWNVWREQHPALQPDLSNAGFDEHEQLSHVNLSGANLSYTYLGYADLYHANLSHACITGTNLEQANLGDADLRGTDLRECYLCQTFFQGANLAGADLRGANLQEADLRGANLTAARLQRANLSHALLTHADLSCASLEGTIFGDVDLRGVEGLETVEHLGPSLISATTLSRSQGDIPASFLRRAGLDHTFVTFAHSLASKPDPYFTCLLSSSEQDQALAQRLFTDLESRNILYWSRSHPVSTNDDIHPERDHIRVYDKLILLLSKHSIQSWWARVEAATAHLMELRRNKPMLITLKLDQALNPVSPPWVDELFRTHGLYDFTHWTDPSEYQRVLTTLLATLHH
jgi:hypothetical protein